MTDDLSPEATGGEVQAARAQLPLALRSHRLVARIIDQFAIGVCWTLIERAVWGSSLEDEALTLRFFLWAALFVAIAAVYEIALVATRGHTLGKYMMGISVSQVNSGLRPGWKRSTRRWALPHLLLLIPYAGIFLWLLCYLSPFWSRNRQGWHDKVAGTHVVKTGPAPPYQSRGTIASQPSR
ncbi:MAG: RDD family protein [bacterium]|nr:RDD family protein [bacterium]